MRNHYQSSMIILNRIRQNFHILKVKIIRRFIKFQVIHFEEIPRIDTFDLKLNNGKKYIHIIVHYFDNFINQHIKSGRLFTASKVVIFHRG